MTTKLLSPLNSKWDMKFYFLQMKFDEVGTILKHPETINGNVKREWYWGTWPSPFWAKHIPHTEEIFPYLLPQISPKGACRETFPQASPYPQSMGNVEGTPPTLGGRVPMEH